MFLINQYNYLQLLYREVKDILLFQRTLDKFGRGSPWPSENFNLKKKVVAHNFIVFLGENTRIFPKTSQNG